MLSALRTAALCAAILASATAAAAPTPTVETALAYLQTPSYLDRALGQLAPALQRRRKDGPVPETQAGQLLGLGKRIYVGSNLYPVFKVAYAKATTLESLTALTSWMETPLGRKIGAAYRAAASAQPKAVQDYYLENEATLLRPNRRNALLTFARASELGQLTATWLCGADLAVLRSLSLFEPPAQRASAAALRTQAFAKADAYAAASLDAELPQLLYLFRGLKNDEIDEYTKLATSAAGQKHAQAFAKALAITLESAAGTLAAQMEKGVR